MYSVDFQNVIRKSAINSITKQSFKYYTSNTKGSESTQFTPHGHQNERILSYRCHDESTVLSSRCNNLVPPCQSSSSPTYTNLYPSALSRETAYHQARALANLPQLPYSSPQILSLNPPQYFSQYTCYTRHATS